MSDLFSNTHGGRIDAQRGGSDHTPRTRAYKAAQRKSVQPGDGLWASGARKEFYKKNGLRPGDLVEYKGRVGQLDHISALRDGSKLTLVLYKTDKSTTIKLREENMELRYRGLYLAVNCNFLEREVMTTGDRRRKEQGRNTTRDYYY